MGQQCTCKSRSRQFRLGNVYLKWLLLSTIEHPYQHMLALRTQTHYSCHNLISRQRMEDRRSCNYRVCKSIHPHIDYISPSYQKIFPTECRSCFTSKQLHSFSVYNVCGIIDMNKLTSCLPFQFLQQVYALMSLQIEFVFQHIIETF